MTSNNKRKSEDKDEDEVEGAKAEMDEVVKKRRGETSSTPAQGDDNVIPVSVDAQQEQKLGFLNLPSELRNKIVEFAMPKEGEVYLRRRGTALMFYKHFHGGMPLNQIRNACKQLRAEMTGMECKFNHVIAEGPLFYQLIREWNASQKKLLRRVTLLPLDASFFNVKKPDEAILHGLLDLCLQNRDIKMCVCLAHWNLSPQTFNTFLDIPSIIQCTLRGNGKVFASSEHKMIERWRCRKPMGQVDAPNLRFFPRDTDLDLERFQTSYKRTTNGHRSRKSLGLQILTSSLDWPSGGK